MSKTTRFLNRPFLLMATIACLSGAAQPAQSMLGALADWLTNADPKMPVNATRLTEDVDAEIAMAERPPLKRNMPPDWHTHNLAVMMTNDPYWVRAKAEVNDFLGKNNPGKPRSTVVYGGPARKLISLTFDDGPKSPATEQLLGILHQANVKATFFVVGKMVRKSPELLKQIADAGHEIANHSFSHVTLSKLDLAQIMTEYKANNLIIRDTVGVSPVWCRPPGGRRNPVVYEGAAMLGMKTALWTSDPLDYNDPGESVLLARLKRDLEPGAIYLLHNGAKDTLTVLPEFIEYARKQGYEFATLSQQFLRPVGAKGKVTKLQSDRPRRAS